MPTTLDLIADPTPAELHAMLAATAEVDPFDTNVTPIKAAPVKRRIRQLPSTTVDGPHAWRVDALCAQTDPEMFFPEKGGPTSDPKKVCKSCEVRSECLDYALDNDEDFGVWGGTSPRERRDIRAGRKPHPYRTARAA
ncbi:WhiB family transcriptional regulator [Agromyces humi]|uniref:WhiB family transcriptional regulator n=1 Tax=Agromyces humi TaxID=1766800 RepID=UPI002E2738C7